MRTSPALHFTHDASQHSSFIKAPVLTRHKTVTHSDRPVCSYVRQYFSQRLPFCGKKPPTQQESYKVLSSHSVGRRIPRATDRTAISLFKHSCINGLLSHRTPPGYKDMHSCCSVAQKLNVISGIPPIPQTG